MNEAININNTASIFRYMYSLPIATLLHFKANTASVWSAEYDRVH
jgi:hypothetical protein